MCRWAGRMLVAEAAISRLGRVEKLARLDPRLVGGGDVEAIRAESVQPDIEQSIVATAKTENVGTPAVSQFRPQVMGIDVGDIHQAESRQRFEEHCTQVLTVNSKSVTGQHSVLKLAKVQRVVRSS